MSSVSLQNIWEKKNIHLFLKNTKNTCTMKKISSVYMLFCPQCVCNKWIKLQTDHLQSQKQACLLVIRSQFRNSVFLIIIYLILPDDRTFLIWYHWEVVFFCGYWKMWITLNLQTKSLELIVKKSHLPAVPSPVVCRNLRP